MTTYREPRSDKGQTLLDPFSKKTLKILLGFFVELSQGNNTVANEWHSVVTSLSFADQLPMAAHDGKLALEKGLSPEVTGLRHSTEKILK